MDQHAIEAGSSATFSVTVRDVNGDAVEDVYTGAEALTLLAWPGGQEPSRTLSASSVSWVSGPAGTLQFELDDDDTDALRSGDEVAVRAEVNGDTVELYRCSLVVLGEPGDSSEGLLLTVGDVRAALGDARAESPAALALVRAASSAIEAYCRRTFAQAEVTELLSGGGHPRLVVARPPIASVTSVEVEGTAVTDYLNCESYLLRGNGRGPLDCAPTWPRGTRNIEVTYTGGFATVPGEVKAAALILVEHHFQSIEHPGLVRRERIGDWEYDLSAVATSSDQLPPAVRALLAPYVLGNYA